MLVAVEVYAVYGARRDDFARIDEWAAELGCDLLELDSQVFALRGCTFELRRDRASRRARGRRVDFDSLLESREPVTTGLERIVPHRAAAVQAVLYHAHGTPSANQLIFHRARPALDEVQATARVRDDAPGQRVAIDEDLLHGRGLRSDRHLTVRERLLPAIDADTGAHAVGPEGVVFEDFADLGFVLGLDDPEPTERLVARHFAHRARHEHAVLHAVEEFDVRLEQLVPQLAHV